MYNLGQVVRGISEYLDNEIVYKISGWQRWVVGAGLGVSLNRSTEIFNELKKNEIVKTLGLIDNDDKIDVDTIKDNVQEKEITVENSVDIKKEETEEKKPTINHSTKPQHSYLYPPYYPGGYYNPYYPYNYYRKSNRKRKSK